MAFIPTPDQFPSWQDWARHVVEVLSNTPEGGSTSTPDVSQTPPIKKILVGAHGAFSLSGQDATFFLGPRHYTLTGAQTAYALTGRSVNMYLASNPPLTALAGSFALTGQTANFTVAGVLPSLGTAVTTFHSIGLYWMPVDETGQSVVPANNAVKVRYQRATEAVWHNGHDMWYDSRGVGGRPAGEARGSIVHCHPGTDYNVEFGLTQADGTTKWVAKLSCTTWSENFDNRVGSRGPTWSGTRSRGNAKAGLHITQSGSPNNYVLYDFTGLGAVLDARNASGDNDVGTYGVQITASYVILRGLKIIGGDYGVFVDPGCTDVVIEKNDISDWGTWIGTTYTLTGPDTNGIVIQRGNNERGGIQLSPTPGNTTTKRIVVQGNRIHNPKYGSMPWDFAHPEGANGIMCYNNGGNNVIRYNEIYSTLDGLPTGAPDFAHFFTDGMGSGNDFGFVGGPSHDSDFYGNIIMHCMDDALETEDDGCNVRVWGNYADYTATAWSSTPMGVGPLYVFRNVYNRSRERYNQQWGNESDRLNCFKIGDALSNGSGASAGQRYLYHNTCLQMAPGSGQGPRNLGTFQAVTGSRNTEPVTRTKTRNNILDTAAGTAFQQANGSFNDFDYDDSNATMGVAESHGRSGAGAIYGSGNGPNGFVYPYGRFRLASGAGFDDGEVIPNFNDDVDAPYQYLGTAPDRGAHEAGSPDMQFGISLAGVDVTTKPLFTAGFETGNMSEMYANTGGEEVVGSSNSGFVEGTNGLTVTTGPNGEFAQAVTDVSHSGSWSAQLYRPNTTESGVRVMRWKEVLANSELYFSWWLYFPQEYLVGFAGWSTFAQITSKNQSGSREDPFWALGYTPSASASDGKPHLSLQWLSNSGESGPQSGMSGANVNYDFPDALPIGQWLNVELHVKAAGDFTGIVEVWQNGVLQQSKTNVKTRYPTGNWASWAMLNYGFNITPTPVIVYIDDVQIATSRIGV